MPFWQCVTNHQGQVKEDTGHDTPWVHPNSCRFDNQERNSEGQWQSPIRVKVSKSYNKQLTECTRCASQVPSVHRFSNTCFLASPKKGDYMFASGRVDKVCVSTPFGPSACSPWCQNYKSQESLWRNAEGFPKTRKDCILRKTTHAFQKALTVRETYLLILLFHELLKYPWIFTFWGQNIFQIGHSV